MIDMDDKTDQKVSSKTIFKFKKEAKKYLGSFNSFETLCRVCQGFRLTKQDDYFWVDFDNFESSSIFGGSRGSIENWFELKSEPT